MKILLDNGHGSNTPGKRSPIWSDGSQLFEWEFNREVVRLIVNSFEYYEINYEIITPEELDVSLTERIRRVNNLSKNEECFLISIHANAGGGTGFEIFTSPGQTKSDEYATVIFNVASQMLPGWRMRKDTSDGDPDKEANFALLKRTICPAVLTENMFMDTEKDCKFLMSEDGREIIADIHVQAVLDILNRAV